MASKEVVTKDKQAQAHRTVSKTNLMESRSDLVEDDLGVQLVVRYDFHEPGGPLSRAP